MSVLMPHSSSHSVLGAKHVLQEDLAGYKQTAVYRQSESNKQYLLILWKLGRTDVIWHCSCSLWFKKNITVSLMQFNVYQKPHNPLVAASITVSLY